MIEPPPNNVTRPKVVRKRDALRVVIQAARSERQVIGLVPTMGALHEGHLSLVRRSVQQCEYTVVTIFVNPTQFGPREDFTQYPRDLDTDLDALARAGADLVYAPAPEEVYPEGFSTFVDPPAVSKLLEGQSRPGHFRGVATVVLKLFQLVPAHFAFFGQKDYQQALVIRHMVRDLDVPIQIEVCPTIREPDGLAKSSRNRYLSASQRTRACALYRCLNRAAELAAEGERNSTALLAAMRSVMESAGITHIDYVALVDPETLENVQQVTSDTIALVAAHVGKTRLIDNRRIG